MPELPEVETVCRGLEPTICGQHITGITLHRPNLRFPFPDGFATKIEGASVVAVRRRAKYILIDLSNNLTWVIHLGMSGRILLNEKATTIHDHVEVALEKGSFVYQDPRRFGYMDILPTDTLENSRWFNALGIEPLSGLFTGSYLHEKFKTKKAPIKNLLLQQSIVVGLGNIYVCEALFSTGIRPTRSGNTISKKQLDLLVENIKIVLHRAIKAGGSSLQDHRQVDGTLGYFQHDFKVYGREGKLCATCKTNILRITQAGRSSFYCPLCQT